MSVLTRLALEDTEASVQALLEPTVERLGYFGELFQYAAHAPAVLEGFMKLSGALRTALPPNLNELIALVVCTQMELPYERIQHERLSQTLGLDRAWIAELVGRGPGAQLSAEERVVRDITLLVIGGNYAQARAKLDTLAADGGSPLAISVLFQITRFMSVCTMGRVLDVSLPMPSIFAADPAS